MAKKRSVGALRLVMLVLLLVAGCGAPPGQDAEQSDSLEQQQLTNLVPTSATCNVGLKAGECISAPPALASAAGRFETDGVRGSNEYGHAVRLPYADLASRATAAVYVQTVFGGPRPPFFLTSGRMHVYLEDIPIRVSDDADLTKAGVLSLYVDASRFTGETDCYDSRRDRRVDFNLLTGEVQVFQPPGAPQTCAVQALGWEQISASGVRFKRGSCRPEPSTPALIRCSGELSLPVNFLDMNVRPGDGLDPGIGFGIVNRAGTGAVPEYLARSSLPAPGNQRVNRLNTPSLLFRRPSAQHSLPLRIMSWNIRRFKSAGLRGEFEKVSDLDVATFLATYDVVAIQEGWDITAVERIFKRANQERAQLGLSPFNLFGPVDFDPSTSKAILQSVGNAALCAKGVVDTNQEEKCETSGTHGGLFVFSSLPVAKEGQVTFDDACKGEDCFRAKGVQWVRLLLNPPDVANYACHGELGLTEGSRSIPASCGPLPSAGHFVDIFNTHLQADNPQLCESATARDNVGSLVLGASVSGPAALGLVALKALVEADLNCADSDAFIRLKQLRLADAFIGSVAAQDRPSLVMGDFNIDGRTLGDEYGVLLHELGIGLPVQDADVGGRDDSTTPWPAAYDWDIDHGDLVRELVDYTTGHATGTEIKEGGGTTLPNDEFPSGASYAGNFDGEARLDYVLVRPPHRPDSEDIEKQNWIALADTDAAGDRIEPWQSPWPGDPNAVGARAPHRYSDHKPVVATLRFAPLAVPGRFHPTWKHDVDQRITSATATSKGDCWGCGKVDLYTKLNYSELLSGAVTYGAHTGDTCNNRDAVSYPKRGCTYNWSRLGFHDGSIAGEAYHRFHADLWDADTSSGDDPIVRWYGQAVAWHIRTVALLRGDIKDSTPDLVDPPTAWLLVDNEGAPHCTPSREKLCFDTKPIELAPGLQF